MQLKIQRREMLVVALEIFHNLKSFINLKISFYVVVIKNVGRIIALGNVS